MNFSLAPLLLLLPALAQAKVLPDAVPFASGQVTQLASSFQDGRSKTYRALVVRTGAVPENQMELVIQKVRQLVSSKGDVTNALIAQLIIPSSRFPSGADTRVLGVHWDPNDQDGEAFVFDLDGHTCRYTFDTTGGGTDLKLEFFSCK